MGRREQIQPCFDLNPGEPSTGPEGKREGGDSFILFCQSIKFLMKTMSFNLLKMTKLGKNAKHGDFLGLGTQNLFPVKILFHKYVPGTHQPAETEAVN